MNSELEARSELLKYVAQALDIPREVDERLTASYVHLARWIQIDHDERFRAGSELYLQGSRRYGTLVLPVRSTDDHDLDAVYLRHIGRTSTTQAELKIAVGEQLRDYVNVKRGADAEVPLLVEGKRCWTLKYQGFHIDVLPALPDEERRRGAADTNIIITDKMLRVWQPSDPEGYARWFEGRMRRVFELMREDAAKSAGVKVHEIPAPTIKTPLQRMVQLLKRHRDIRFVGHPDHRPASIIITTVAALSYDDEPNLLRALMAFVSAARQLIVPGKDGVYWLRNPVNPDENFADRWVEKPDRVAAFFGWIDDLGFDLGAISREQGFEKLASPLSRAFGDATARAAFTSVGNQMRGSSLAGSLRVQPGKATLVATGGISVRPHTFFGD